MPLLLSLPVALDLRWGAGIHAGYRSVTGTARLRGQFALGAVRDLVDGSFAAA